ncbi:ABC transporter ATP-binding protein [Alloalcanivorax sp. C16-2]|uniref:ABC transporter ATP-binding protein n=1 Tax=Alloalcanivorax TaxID=3020832 RepID=UPI001931381A|nr:ABC transporter ATP-binding protein [Alloalcanivorax marinus]MBL7249058.1 ABC transporter ATP-binding protein [Alloalcanivorax marinus]
MSDNPGSPAIQTRGLTRRFGDLVAVDHLDLSVPRGQVYGFLGPNGCGKSTTIRMLCGLLLPSDGDIRVLDLDIPRQAETLKQHIGYMTQSFSLYRDLSVRENLEFVARLFGLSRARRRQRLDELFQTYRLEALSEQLAGTLSGGQRQRLALAAAVLNEPELLFLDEPTSAVDPQSRRDFWDVLFGLADSGTTLLVSTHYMDEAERCHRLAILQQGELVAEGSPDQLKQRMEAVSLLVETDRPRRAQHALDGLEGVRSCAQIGATLRVLVDDEAALAPVRQRVRTVDPDAGVNVTDVNLEDVFVAATLARARHGEAQ